MKIVRLAAFILTGSVISSAPSTARAYHFVGTAPNGCRWAGTPNFTVDGSSSAAIRDALLADALTARATWNDVATARDVFGSFTAVTLNYDENNRGSAWGVGATSGDGAVPDGRNEIVLDETGNILRGLGADPAVVNGYSSYRLETIGGACVITDAFYVLNGTRGDFDRLSNMVHELGHILGLAHSSIGQVNSYNNMAFSGAASTSPSAAVHVPNILDVPAMHPFADGTGGARRTLKADDIAGLTELYPEPNAALVFGAITGTMQRCLGNAPLLGVNVRAVNRADPRIQISRYTSFDGNTEGRYLIQNMPPGDYDVVVEQMGQNGFTAGAMGIVGRTDGDFPAEFINRGAAGETGCSEAMPDTSLPVTVQAGATLGGVDGRTINVDIAWVVDDTGSMWNEIDSVRLTLNSLVTRLGVVPGGFPTVAIVSFKDDVMVRHISNNPVELRAIISGLQAAGGGDCPESSAAAILEAARLVEYRGTVTLFTDADAREDGPTRDLMLQTMAAKRVIFSVMLSATCAEEFADPDGFAAFGAMGAGGHHALQCSDPAGCAQPGLSSAPIGGAGPSGASNEEFRTPPGLGFEDAVTTFSQLAAETHGIFFATPRPYTEEARERYVNTAANIAYSASYPAVGLVAPLSAPQGSALTIEVTGLNTNWQPGSAVSFPGTAIAVGAVMVASATKLYVDVTIPAAEPLGFRTIEVVTSHGPGDPEVAEGVGSFQVRPAPLDARLVSVSPSQSTVGATVELLIRGVNTSFDPSTTVELHRGWWGPDAGVSIVSTIATDATTLSAVVNISSAASPGLLEVRVIDGGSVLSIPRALLVTAAPPPLPRIASISRTEAARGQTGVLVTVFGEHTHFTSASRPDFGEGIIVVGSTAVSATELIVEFDIESAAAPGFRDVRVITGEENAVLIDGFNLLCRAPVVETCSNGADDDSNGLMDCADPACASQALCQPPTWCSRAACNDGNPCTNDGCVNGACVHTPTTESSCSGGTCNAAGECQKPALSFACNLEGSARSAASTYPIPIDFRNYRAAPVHVYRLDESGARQEVCGSPFAPGEAYREPTYSNAYYLVADAAGACLGIYKNSYFVTAVETTP